MNEFFTRIKLRLRELDNDEHLQPFTGKKRVDYDVETHGLFLDELQGKKRFDYAANIPILWLDELEEGKLESRIERARWYIAEMRRASFNSVSKEDAIKLLARIDSTDGGLSIEGCS